MKKVRTKKSYRLLAAVLSLLMMVSMFSFSMVVDAATTAHPDAHTITVKDEESAPVEGATVKLYHDFGAGTLLDLSAATGADGTAAFSMSDVAAALTAAGVTSVNVQVTVSKDGFKSKEYTDDISAESAYHGDVTLESALIKDVEIVGKNLPYTGSAQKLVSVTEVEGDTVFYYLNGATNPTTQAPMETNAGTYSVRVVVTREGKDPLEKTVEAVINPAKIEGIDIAPIENLKYNGTEQELVALTGSFAQGDSVVWIVDDDEQNSSAVPKKMAVGTYAVTLKVHRGANYEDFQKTVSVTIALGDIDLGKLTIEPNNTTYDGAEHPLLKEPVNPEGYTLQYSVDNKATWQNDIPMEANAGAYEVHVKISKENYKETIIPFSVTIAQAEQSLRFNKYIPHDTAVAHDPQIVAIEGDLPFTENNKFDFSAIDDQKKANGTITYSIVADTHVASIDASGNLVVENPGEITVIATLSGNNNYKSCEIKYCLRIYGKGKFLSFDEAEKTYVLSAASEKISEQAVKVKEHVTGDITYKMNKIPAGVSFNEIDGTVSVGNYAKLANAIHENNGSLKIEVIAVKNETAHYAEDSASYVINVTFAEAPENPVSYNKPEGGKTWYNKEVEEDVVVAVTPLAGHKIAKMPEDESDFVFNEKVVFNDQGEADRYVYLRNSEGLISEVKIKIKIDTIMPDEIMVEYFVPAKDKFLSAITLGFYNPSVTVRLTAYDDTSGIDYFTWYYTRDEEASANKHPESATDQVSAVQDATDKTKYTAEFTITADEENQYRGYLTVTATDKAENVSNRVTDNGNVFVVDTIHPEMSITYKGVDPETSEIDDIDGVHYFNGDVEATLIVNEANFYASDVDAMVSKNGEEAVAVNPTWTGEGDTHYGKFILTGDGDYVVTVDAKDKSGNPMKPMNPYTSEVITIDTTAPKITPEYKAEDTDKDGIKESQAITIRVEEHNFRASDIEVVVDARDINGSEVSVKDVQSYAKNEENWSNSDTDTHTLVLESTGEDPILVDAIYKLEIDYVDISGNIDDTDIENCIIDHTGPTGVEIEIETTPFEEVVMGIVEKVTFGFFKPSVSVRFTAYDEMAGVKNFAWNYTKENGASDINRATDKESTLIDAVQDAENRNKFTATITLPDTDATQLRGYLAASATDKHGYTSDKVTDEKNIIVVDTIAPEVSIEYSQSGRDINGKAYYNGDVEATLIVNEANFYASDVVAKVSKNGGEAVAVNPAWTAGEGDTHYGKFILTGDGHYIVTAEYTDKSTNFDAEKSTYTSHEITIDTTLPVIHVDYKNKNVVNNLVDQEGNQRGYSANMQTAVVTIDEHNFIADEVAFTIVAKDVSGKELNATDLSVKGAWTVDATGDVHSITIRYPGDANYTFDVAYTDKATNAAEDYAEDHFTVDKTKPANLTVDYSTSLLDTILESVTFGFYNAKMTVKLTAEDSISEVHSFLYSYMNAKGVSGVNAELINQAIQASKIQYSADRKTASVTFEIPKMVLGNDNQFNGTVAFNATDRAGNQTETHRETKRIVVDNIAPTAQVSYNEATNVVGNISYYNKNIEATVTINEANFYASDVQVVVSKDGVASAVTPKWTDNSVDEHVGTFTLTEDGDYFVTINYMDKSSNRMATYSSQQMTIDTEINAPVYSINGVSKTGFGGSYKGDAKIGYSFSDQNFDTRTITLTRTRFDKVEEVTEIFINPAMNEKGGSGSFVIPDEVENDGIYLLKIAMTDKARHEVESEIEFTINRYGSVYKYSDSLVNLIKDGGQYVKSVDSDLVITEYNADQILENSLNLLVTRDGEAIDVDFDKKIKTIDGGDEGNEAGWNQYDYTIKASNFEKDGVYKISLTSKYAATDSPENESASVPENSVDMKGEKIIDAMTFTVDSIAPEIRNIVNLDKPVVNAQSLDVKYTIVDVGGLKSVEVVLNGKSCGVITEFGDDAYSYSGQFSVKENKKAQTIQIKVTDLAGNVTNTASDDFDTKDLYTFYDKVTVSTNFFVRWYAHTVLFWSSIGGTIVLAAGIWFVVAAMRKKKIERDEK